MNRKETMMHVVYEIDLMDKGGNVLQQVNVLVKHGPKAIAEAVALALKFGPKDQALTAGSARRLCVVQAVGKVK